MEELVSIIMPNYNCGTYLVETLNSVLSQTYSNWELIIVDDCSDDNSIDIIQKYQKKDNRIKIFLNQKNSGAAYSRNLALREAKGKWIAFLDSDDIWERNKLERQLSYMKANNLNFSYTSYREIDELSRKNGIVINGPKVITRRKMYHFNYIGCLTVMYNCEKVGLIQVDESLKSKNDYAIWLKICKVAECFYLNEILASYRVRKKSVSHIGLGKSMKNQYLLYRNGEKENCFLALWHTLGNVFYGFLKKIIYKRKSDK